MPYGSLSNPSVNPMTQMPPKAPSALVKTTRWTLFLSGIIYGAWRLRSLKPIQEAINEKESILYEFLKARGEKFHADKTIIGAEMLRREANGISFEGLPDVTRPLLVDDE